MSLCYFCGREEETFRCSHCGIKFCAEHLPPQKHNCIAYSGRNGVDVPKAKAAQGTEPATAYPIETPPRRQPTSQTSHKNKQTIAIILIAVSIVSVIGVIMFASGPQSLPGVGPTTIDIELHSVALAQVNVYRLRNDLPELDYDADTVAQAFADKMARSGVLEHNPELPSNTGENVASRTDRGQDPKITVSLMIQDMVTNDDANGGANRANILNNGYTELSVGVALQGDTVYLVLNFH